MRINKMIYNWARKMWHALPEPIRTAIIKSGVLSPTETIYRNRAKKELIKNEIQFADNDDAKAVIEFLRHNRPVVFPYQFTSEYSPSDYLISRDEDGYPYVIHNNNRLFGLKEYSNEAFASYYCSLMIEQDKRSPHSYICNSERIPFDGCTIADLGAAEGIFALDWVDHAKKIYLFECNPQWIVPLQKTFSPWAEKVEIVAKKIGNKTSGDETTLDDFFTNKEVTFIKADIEGAEADMLKGGEITFQEKVQQALICTYHRFDHEAIVKKTLENYGFITEHNSGYMLFFCNKIDFKKAYLRRGIVYAVKQRSDFKKV